MEEIVSALMVVVSVVGGLSEKPLEGLVRVRSKVILLGREVVRAISGT